MKSKFLKIISSLLISAFICTTLLAADYSSMTMKELIAIRGTLINATEEERQDFRDEWQKRLLTMTPEERQRYAGSPLGLSRGNGLGDNQSRILNRRNSGAGSGYGRNQRQNRGNGNGYGRK
jgi:hypothetical protein